MNCSALIGIKAVLYPLTFGSQVLISKMPSFDLGGW